MVVVASAGSEAGQKYAQDQGANFAVAHDVTEKPERVNQLTNGKGFDLILEMLANKNLASDLKSVARHGRIVVIGSRGSIEIEPRDTMARESEIIGLMLGGANEIEHRGIYSALTAALENRTLRPVVGMKLPLADAAKAHREVIEGDAHGKIVLIP